MEINDDARRLFEEMNLSRDAAEVIAKGLAQRIIDTAEDPPLQGIVYDVWGLYNEGIPRCRFSIEDASGHVTFEGRFKATNARSVSRSLTCTPDEMLAVLDEVKSI